jgi:hypothetical protein
VAGSFIDETCTFQTDAAYGVYGSALQPAFYAGGLVHYKIFKPDPVAVAASEWSGRSLLPAIVQCQGSGAGNLTGVSANEGEQMAQQSGVKLGYNYGGVSAPVSDWLSYGIYPQFLFSAPDGDEPNASNRLNRSNLMILEAVVLDAMSKHPIDPFGLVGHAFSGGTSTLMQYTYGRRRWPSRFKLDFACQILFASAIASDGSNYRNTFPWMEQNENSNNQTTQRIAMAMERNRILTFLYGSDNDTAVGAGNRTAEDALFARYTPFGTAVALPAGESPGNIRIGGSGWLRSIRYTGSSAPTPSHQGTWDLGLSGNVAGGPMVRTQELWQLAFAQRPVSRHHVMPYRGAHRRLY